MDFIGTTAVLGVLIPIIALILTGAIIIVAIQRNYRIRQLEHQERLAAIEKGVDIPMKHEKPKPHYPFTWPFIFIGLGLALVLIFLFAPHANSDTLGWGLVILFIGGALFASRFYGVKKDEMDDTERKAKENGVPGNDPAAAGAASAEGVQKKKE
jgi:hypothetical protein